MKKENFQYRVQNFGRFLSGMVMPNIGAFIAWGLITAFFIPTGWIPNESFGSLVGPMIKFLLPLLIGYTGGKIVAGTRGGVLGAIATMGIIVGADIPMFIGAMIMGPLGGYLIKKLDEIFEGKIPAGFEMLVNNFSAGIVGALLAIIAYQAIGPVVLGLNNILKAGVEAIVNAGLLPLTSLFIEPGKILFLNNAINHGVLGPLGIQEVNELGKSIFFLLETNPGPGLGILLAYWAFSKGTVKQSSPGAIIIHFFGGIHEIYFPYVLMKPILVLAVIAGGISGVFTFNLFGAGLVATPSPGSIFALMAMTPRGGWFSVLLGVVVSAVVSFLVASIFIKKSDDIEDEEELRSAKERVQNLKGKTEDGDDNSLLFNGEIKANFQDIKKIIFACDAGMGSSAMGASRLRNKLNKVGLDIEVSNKAIEDIPEDAQIVVTHESLTDRAKNIAPQAEHISIQDFIQTPAYDLLVERVRAINNQAEESANSREESEEIKELPILKKENIRLGLESIDRDQAIRMAGQILVDEGYVEEDYIDAMLERERELTTYVGQGVAIPHGVGAAKKEIKKTGISILQFPEGIAFEDGTAYLVIGIAGLGNEHLKILASLSELVEDTEMAKKLWETDDLDYIYELFTV
ncbi:PTS mannitol transporter subunit IICBA [Halocella sp. SP3-1]|nr:PTS mannitol transporter subunit IICBA [Halocella sp. SP3-1]AZO94403.1 PTS mannitol transporter subunit IICBA [Halocella sp. SP3-1]